MFKISKNSINSYLAYTYNHFKKLVVVGSIICASLYILQLMLSITATQIYNVSINNNSGMLIVGTTTLLITFIVGFIIITSKQEIKNAFRFSINRPTYAFGALISILIASLAIICLVSVFYVIETLTYAFLSSTVDHIVFISSITVQGYFDGILPTYTTIVLILSVTYMISMYISRYKLPAILLLASLIFLIIMFPGFRNSSLQLFSYGFEIDSIILFSLYMLGMSIIAHVLAFIPIKTMEVR